MHSNRGQLGIFGGTSYWFDLVSNLFKFIIMDSSSMWFVVCRIGFCEGELPESEYPVGYKFSAEDLTFLEGNLVLVGLG